MYLTRHKISIEQFIDSNRNVLFFPNQFYDYWKNSNPPQQKITEKLWFRFYEEFAQEIKIKEFNKREKRKIRIEKEKIKAKIENKIKENEIIYWK